MQVINKNEGSKIPYKLTKTKISFNDGELTLDLERYQRDWDVTIDICRNKDNMLVIGTGTGLYYVAQIVIPATQYELLEESVDNVDDGDNRTSEQLSALPLDTNQVILYLWEV